MQVLKYRKGSGWPGPAITRLVNLLSEIQHFKVVALVLFHVLILLATCYLLHKKLKHIKNRRR